MRSRMERVASTDMPRSHANISTSPAQSESSNTSSTVATVAPTGLAATAASWTGVVTATGGAMSIGASGSACDAQTAEAGCASIDGKPSVSATKSEIEAILIDEPIPSELMRKSEKQGVQ